MPPERVAIRLQVITLIHYYADRRRSLELFNRVFSFLILMLGTASVAELTTGFGLDARVTAVVVAAIGGIQLVWDPGRLARDHQVIHRDYVGLFAEIEGAIDPDLEARALWSRRIMEISAGGPPVYRAVMAAAHNAAYQLLDIPHGMQLHIPKACKLLRDFRTFPAVEFERNDERAARRARRCKSFRRAIGLKRAHSE